MTRDLFAALRSYYDRNGIGAEHFRCIHERVCRGTCDRFSSAKEAYVGDLFAAGDLPRLVFLSLDSGDGGDQWHATAEEAAQARTLEALQAHENRVNVNDLPKGHHWYQTRALALELLRPLKPALTIEAIHRHYAHTNSAKCCLNNPKRSEADARLFRNCRGFIPGELEILAPDILVTQGRWAKVAVSEGFVGRIGREMGTTAEAGRYRAVSISGPESTLWFHSYHPASYGRYWPQTKRDWRPWTDVVQTRFGNGLSSRG